MHGAHARLAGAVPGLPEQRQRAHQAPGRGWPAEPLLRETEVGHRPRLACGVAQPPAQRHRALEVLDGGRVATQP